MTVVVRLEDVHRVFATTPPVAALRGIDLVIDEAEVLGIVGPSGSGKSTLLNMIGLLDVPSTGIISLNGVPVPASERARARLRGAEVGFVFQRFHLMPRRSAVENVEVGLLYRGIRGAVRRELAIQALDAVGMGHRAQARCETLSGGESQRVAIARAMVGSPAIILADEPTGNLDSEAGAIVVDNLLRANQFGATVVVVTHDRDLAESLPRRVEILDGRVIGDVRSSAWHGQTATLGTSREPKEFRSARVRDLIGDAIRGLVTRPGRTSGLVAAVGLAVALVVITLGLGSSASAQVDSTFDRRLNRSVTVHYPTTAVPTLSSARAQQVEAKVRQLNGVVTAGLGLELDTIGLRYGTEAEAFSIAAVSPAFLDAVDADVLWAQGYSSLEGERTVLLGSLVASELGLGPVDGTPTVTLGGLAYTVIGVVENGGRVPQLQGRIITQLGEAANFGPALAATVEIEASPGAARQVAGQVGLALLPQAPQTMDVEVPPDATELRGEIQSSVQSALIALAIVSSIMSILGVANAMLLSVIERTGEFGLRRALGARRSQIHLLASAEATAIGAWGGMAGLFVGGCVILGVTVANQWSPVFDPKLGLLALGCGMLVGILGGIPAAIRAGRVQPADALRR